MSAVPSASAIAAAPVVEERSLEELLARQKELTKELEALNKLIAKAAKKAGGKRKRTPKVDAEGKPVKGAPSAWAAWTAHAKTAYAAEYETVKAAALADGKKANVMAFAAAARDKHAADFKVFNERHAAAHGAVAAAAAAGAGAGAGAASASDAGGYSSSASTASAKPKKAAAAAPAAAVPAAAAPAAKAPAKVAKKVAKAE
jgi:large subunit ribosomal protein L22e